MSGSIEKWEKVKLEEISQIIAGQSPSSDTYNFEKRGLPFYQGKADFGPISPTAKVWCSKPLKIAEKGDILLSVRAPVGPTNIATEKCCIGRGLCAIRVNDNICMQFIYLYFKLFEKNISRLGSGSTFTAITNEDVKNIEIFLPPLEEQKRIVKIIETKLTAVGKAKIASDEQLSAIKILFDLYIDNAFKSENWDKIRLGDIALITSSKRVFESEWKTNGVPFYRAREIVKLAKQGFIENEIFISEQMFIEYSQKYGKPQENDIMITGVGTLGVCYLVKKNDRFYFKDGNIIWVKNIKDSILPKFLFFALNSKFIQNQIKSFSSGNTVGTYTIENAKRTIIPLPKLDEQNHIINLIETKLFSIKKLKNVLCEQLSYIDAFPISILRKAFNGGY